MRHLHQRYRATTLSLVHLRRARVRQLRWQHRLKDALRSSQGLRPCFSFGPKHDKASSGQSAWLAESVSARANLKRTRARRMLHRNGVTTVAPVRADSMGCDNAQ